VAIAPPVEPCVVKPASSFTHTDERHTRPWSHAPPCVHAHPSAPNAQLVAVVEEQAIHEKDSASALKTPIQIRLFLILSSS
jgi:hypothetical protein